MSGANRNLLHSAQASIFLLQNAFLKRHDRCFPRQVPRSPLIAKSETAADEQFPHLRKQLTPRNVPHMLTQLQCARPLGSETRLAVVPKSGLLPIVETPKTGSSLFSTSPVGRSDRLFCEHAYDQGGVGGNFEVLPSFPRRS